MKPNPPQVVECPPDIIEAAIKIQNWALMNNLGLWQIHGVCSRMYAIRVMDNVPKLKVLKDYWNKTVQQEHNKAVHALRELV